MPAWSVGNARHRIGRVPCGTPTAPWSKGERLTSCTVTPESWAPFGTIREIHGRSVDYFPLPDGRLLHPYELSMNIPDRWPWVRRYQLVQERRDLIRMRIEAYGAPPSDREIADVRAVAAGLLGPGVAFEVEMVERLGADANGKFRVSRTLVPREDGER